MRRRAQTILRSPKLTIVASPAKGPPNADLLDMRNISLALINLSVSTKYPDRAGYELHVRGEALFAAALVRLFQIAAPEESIFVATPHRIQRHAVKDALRTRVDELSEAFGTLNLEDESQTIPVSNAKLTIDTIERLQGQLSLVEVTNFINPRTHRPSHNRIRSRLRYLPVCSYASGISIYGD